MDYVYKGDNIPRKNTEFIRKVGDSPKALVSLIFQQDTLSEQLRSFNLKSDIVKAIVRTKLLRELREKMGMVYSVSVIYRSDTISCTTFSGNNRIQL